MGAIFTVLWGARGPNVRLGRVLALYVLATFVYCEHLRTVNDFYSTSVHVLLSPDTVFSKRVTRNERVQRSLFADRVEWLTWEAGLLRSRSTRFVTGIRSGGYRGCDHTPKGRAYSSVASVHVLFTIDAVRGVVTIPKLHVIMACVHA